jgi:hypothetical protein
MTSSDEIEFTFVIETLRRFGLRLQFIFMGDISAKSLVKTGNLKGGIKAEVNKSGEVGGELRFSFPDYGRFIEINYHKGSDNGFRAFGSKNRGTLKSKNKFKSKTAHKKDTRWYAKNAYGYLNSLIGELMFGFTDEVREEIRDVLLKI